MGGSAQNTLENCIGTPSYEVVLVQGLTLESGMTPEQESIVQGRLRQAQELGVTIIVEPALVRRISPLLDLRAVWSLWRIIRAERPDIVHTHTSKAGIVGRLAAWLAGAPVIIHTTHGHVFYGHFSPLLSKVYLIIERIFATFTHRMVALTEGEKQDFLKFSLCPEGKIVKIHSGVKIDKYLNAKVNRVAFKQELGIHANRLVVGTVGWLWPIKGPMYLLKAMGKVWEGNPECELVYVGKGELEAELRATAAAMGVSDKVNFLGWREDIYNIMPLFDLFALPSLNEGMGRVLVEAMAAGKPLVASEVGGVPDLVTPGATGILVPPGDVEALAAAISEILNDPVKAQKMGDTGRRACRHYSVAAMLERLVTMYDDTLTAQGKRLNGKRSTP